MSELLSFFPFSSAVDVGFWYQLTQQKLDVFKLDDAPVSIWGSYTCNSSPRLPPIANIDYSSLNELRYFLIYALQISSLGKSFPLVGTLINTNTLEAFRSKDKKELLYSAGEKIMQSIQNGDALNNPGLLQSIVCLTFADLKKYHYFYWFAFPALIYPDNTTCGRIMKFSEYFPENQTNQFLSSYEALSSTDQGAFLIHKDAESCSVAPLSDYKALVKLQGEVLLGFADPSSHEKYPGWPLRNLLALVAYHWGSNHKQWDIVCFRGCQSDLSLVMSVTFNPNPLPSECPGVVGWEKNNGKLMYRKVDMSGSMDPTKLADAAVDLNLKLMRWRLVPDLKLPEIKSAHCLLFGAGTLGCNVARCLMGWGVRKITLVDNSRVSYSNPVRQTLFTFQDCLRGGKEKALAAAQALSAIFPGAEVEGKVLSVPMPGHAMTKETLENIRDDTKQIEGLIDNHDVIFLLMDSRESRWLPTLLGAAKHKLVINAALGFDTYLVMRHGFRSIGGDGDGAGLGCYFCNDVVAPGNSVQDRTLDQQCTVTRPGVSYIAAALAVELMVSVLQHPESGLCSPSSDTSTELGMIPHQIRGYLHKFQNTLLTSRAYDRCTACSDKVIALYTSDGFNFLEKAFNDPNYLEKVTGLAELMTNINMDEILVLSDDDSV